MFDAIADEVFFRVADARLKDFNGSHHDGVIRAWSCGSSTGEEAYSLSMIWQYHYARLSLPLGLHVLGTDRSASAVKAAKSAVYACHSLHDLPQPLHQAYTSDDLGAKANELSGPETDDVTSDTPYYPPGTEPMSHYTRTGRKRDGHPGKEARLSSAIRRRCRFTIQDFNDCLPTSDGPFDIILARYSVLLYSEQAVAIISKMVTECLAPGGFLVVGASDNISPQLSAQLHLHVMASKHTDSSCIYQYLPPEVVLLGSAPPLTSPTTSNAINRRGDETSASAVPSLPLLAVSPEHQPSPSPVSSLPTKLSCLEQYSSLGHFTFQALGYKPPAHEAYGYITKGSERILAKMSARPPLHIQTRFIPPFVIVPDRDENIDCNWDASIQTDEGAWKSVADEGAKLCPRPIKRVAVEEMNAIVARMTKVADETKQKRERKMKEFWKAERKALKVKKKKDRRRRKRLLMKVRRTARLQQERKLIEDSEKAQKKPTGRKSGRGNAQKIKKKAKARAECVRPQTAPVMALSSSSSTFKNRQRRKCAGRPRVPTVRKESHALCSKAHVCNEMENREWRKAMHMRIRQTVNN